MMRLAKDKVRRSVLVIAIAGFAVLGLVGRPAAQVSSISSSVSYQAPDWPFQGAVHYYGSGSGNPSTSDTFIEVLHGLQYHASTDGTVTELDMGAGEDLEFCGPGEMYAGPLGMWLASFDGVRNWVEIYVPWGDSAYPMFTRSLLARTFWDSWQSHTSVGGSSIETSHADYGWVTVAIDAMEQHYPYRNPEYDGNDPSRLGLSLPSEPPPDWEIGSTVDMSHSDGVHYGVNFKGYDEICGGRQTYVFSVRSGELVACGWGHFGPIFVASQDALDSSPPPSFPVDAYWHEPLRGCEGAFPMDALLHMASRASQ